MFTKILGSDTGQKSQPHIEGELYKIIHLRGKTFEIRYGYYEDCDRYTQYAEPMEIYPNFRDDPVYADDGSPFVTAMQSPCDHFNGIINENSTCEDCAFYLQGEELIGICTCARNQKSTCVYPNECYSSVQTDDIPIDV